MPGVQALQAAMRERPILLVLDNVSTDTAAAAMPFLAPKHPGSLLLATSWYAQAFADISRAQVSAGHSQLTVFQPLSMATALPLQRQQAVQLIQQQMQQARRAAQQQPLPDDQLVGLADRAAAALAFSTLPAYVPTVLMASAHVLGRIAEQADGVSLVLQQLQAAKGDSAPGDLQPAASDAVFGQLAACFNQLSAAAQQIFLDLAVARQQQADQCSLSQLALWLSCRQVAACSLEEATAEVGYCC